MKAIEKNVHSDKLNWSLTQRLEFIEFRLFWDERINRGDLVSFFGISIPQASSDFTKYQTIAPENMIYDKSGKFYYASSSFNPIYYVPSAEQYLLRCLAVTWGAMKEEKSFIGLLPAMSSVPTPWRRVDINVLKSVLHAIRKQKTLEIVYQSLNREERLTRKISPHAFGFDGLRWHCRAYCHIDLKFKDFILGRIVSVISIEDSSVLAQSDKEWNTELTIRLAASPDLKPSHREIVEYEYGMEHGEASIVVRQALLPYVLKRLGFDRDDLNKNSLEQHIALINIDEIKNYLH